MVGYFLFIALFGDNKDKPHSIIIFISCLIFSLTPLPSAISLLDHISNKENYLFYDAATALILCTTLNIDRTSYKQVLLLGFAMMCHIMIILHIITDSYSAWAMSLPFYSNYKGLIIAVCLLQMVVSYNGLRGATINTYRYIQVMLSWFRIDNSLISKGLHTQEKRKAKVWG